MSAIVARPSIDLRHCSDHPRCAGPTLKRNHRCRAGEDCDNDQCWLPCPFCITDDEVVLYQSAQ